MNAERLHKYCIYNKKLIEQSKVCGCFYCQKTFSPKEIVEYTDEDNKKGPTALCPYCSIDAVLGDAVGVEITPKLLKHMNERYF